MLNPTYQRKTPNKTTQPTPIQMKIKSALSTSFALLVIALSAIPANAQHDNAQATFGNLIAALNNVNVQTGDIDVVVVDLSNVLKGANINALNNALNNNHIELFSGQDSDVVDIQNVLNDLEIDVDIENVLNDLEVEIEDVLVAVNVLTGQVFVLLLP